MTGGTHEALREGMGRAVGSHQLVLCLLGCLLVGWTATGPAGAAGPWQVKLVLNNDYLTNNNVDDDFYTFAARFELTYAAFTLLLEENAFTDRVDGERFDETYLTVGRLLPSRWVGRWDVWVEGGAAHVGEGLLGESAQNEIHDLFGIDPVRLDYLAGVDDYYLHLQAEIGRQWRLGKGWTWGPQVGLSATPGFRWNAMAGWRTVWRPSGGVSLDVTVGGRHAGTEMALLEPHLRETGPAALVTLELPGGFLIEWSLSRYGTDREHLSFGYSFGSLKRPRRPGDVP